MDDDESTDRAARRRRWSGSDDFSGTADPVTLYLREIGRVEPLTAKGEVDLAVRIKAGEAAVERLAEWSAAGRLDDMPAAEVRRLRELEVDGSKAKAALVQANLRQVVLIAKRYSSRGMPLLNLVHEGNKGLMRAAERFDHTKRFKFSTWATWWIRQEINRAIADQARTIRIPEHMVESINKLHRAQRQIVQNLERDPTAEELAEWLDMPVERVREIQRLALEPSSLDSPVDDDDDSFLGDLVRGDDIEEPSIAATRQMLRDEIKDILVGLNEGDREVVLRRFRLEGDAEARTSDVGRDVSGLTHEVLSLGVYVESDDDDTFQSVIEHVEELADHLGYSQTVRPG